MSSFLFGYELNKEVEELTKSHKLSSKVTPWKCMEPYRVPSGRGRAGPNMVPAESQAVINKDSVGSSTEVGQVSANLSPFKAGGLQYCLHEQKKITSDPFILDAVSHCHIEFDWVPEAFSGATRPYHSFTEAEQTIISNEIDKFLLKEIIRISLYEDGQVISPIFIRPKKDGSHRLIFNLKRFNEAASYHHFKMVTLETAIKLMRPGCYMTSIDLKDAYYSIPIAPNIRNT